MSEKKRFLLLLALLIISILFAIYAQRTIDQGLINQF